MGVFTVAFTPEDSVDRTFSYFFFDFSSENFLIHPSNYILKELSLYLKVL